MQKGTDDADIKVPSTKNPKLSHDLLSYKPAVDQNKTFACYAYGQELCLF